MYSLGIGTTHDMKSVISGIFIPSWLASEYSPREKTNIWRGRSFSRRTFGLWDRVLQADLSTVVPSLEIRSISSTADTITRAPMTLRDSISVSLTRY